MIDLVAILKNTFNWLHLKVLLTIFYLWAIMGIFSCGDFLYALLQLYNLSNFQILIHIRCTDRHVLASRIAANAAHQDTSTHRPTHHVLVHLLGSLNLRIHQNCENQFDLRYVQGYGISCVTLCFLNLVMAHITCLNLTVLDVMISYMISSVEKIHSIFIF